MKRTNSIINNTNASLHKKIKSNFITESYVYSIHNRRNQFLISRLRAGCLVDLEIETGQSKNVTQRGVNKDERICTLCYNDVYDEI